LLSFPFLPLRIELKDHCLPEVYIIILAKSIAPAIIIYAEAVDISRLGWNTLSEKLLRQKILVLFHLITAKAPSASLSHEHRGQQSSWRSPHCSGNTQACLLGLALA
jgi:hypothetical protein